MAKSWSIAAARYLTDPAICPNCDATIADGRCAACGLDLRGEAGTAIWTAGTEAAEAIRRRQRLVEAAIADAVPEGAAAAAPGAAPVAAPAMASAAAPATVVQAVPPAPSDRAQWSVQSLLAIAGAGLVAVAAFVFTFFNPDVTSSAVRLAIVGTVTVLFGAVAMLTARRLRLTAESLAALSAVFVGLDVWLLGDLIPDASTSRAVVGIGLLVTAVVLLALGARTGLRGWLVGAVLALGSFAPVLAGAADDVTIERWGFVAIGAAALVGHAVLARIAASSGARLRAERVVLAVAQGLGAAWVVTGFLQELGAGRWTGWLVLAAQFAAVAVFAFAVAARIAPRLWSGVGGVAAVLAGVAAALAPDALREEPWVLVAIAGAIVVVLLVLAALDRAGVWGRRPFRAAAGATILTSSAMSVLVLAAPLLLAAGGAVVIAVMAIATAPTDLGQWGASSQDRMQAAIALAVALVGAGLVAQRLVHRDAGTPVVGGVGVLGPWIIGVGIAIATVWTGFPWPAQAVLPLVVAAIVAIVLGRPGVRAAAPGAVRAAGAVLAHGLVILAILVGLIDSSVFGSVAAGVGLPGPGLREAIWLAAILVLVPVAALVPPSWRPLHWAVGDVLLLGAVASAMDRTELDGVARLAVVAAVGAAVAIIVTLIGRIPRGAWFAVLVVTAVPFLMAVGSVLVERSGWTALSTATTAVLAFVIVLSRRPGIGVALRVVAAGLVLPALAVTAVCLGAWLLVTSGSPVVLPVVAVLVAAVLASAGWIESWLAGRGVARPSLVAGAVEISAGVTGAIAVVLAVLLVASGFGTAMIVLLVVGVGAAAARLVAGRAWGWWVAAASWTGALWCGLLLAEIRPVEPYVLPPAAAAFVVGVVGLVRGRAGRLPASLVVVGIGVGVLPTLVVLALEHRAAGDLPWRAIGLAIASAVMLVAWLVLRGRTGSSPDVERPAGRVSARLHTLRLALGIGAMLAAAGPAVQSIRWAVDVDPIGVTPVMLASLPSALLAAGLAAAASRAISDELHPAGRVASGRDGTVRPWRADRLRWLGVAALVLLLPGPVLAVRDDGVSIWTLWALMAALFALALVATTRGARGTTLLPPVWITALAGWVAAVASWSQRELRVEVYSLPMGLAVTAIGVVAVVVGSARWAAAADSADLVTAGHRPGELIAGTRGGRRVGTLDSWPAGFSGSWWLLGPGLVLTFLPSVLSTGTDPVTWRAILMIALALVSILVGSVAKLAAPFWVGLAVLPIENVVVFAVRIGDGVESLPWWITLATAGAVLLAIAMNAERRSASGATVSRIGEMR